MAESNQTYFISTVALTSELHFKIRSAGKKNKTRSWFFIQFYLILNKKYLIVTLQKIKSEDLGLIISYILCLYTLNLQASDLYLPFLVTITIARRLISL